MCACQSLTESVVHTGHSFPKLGLGVTQKGTNEFCWQNWTYIYISSNYAFRRNRAVYAYTINYTCKLHLIDFRVQYKYSLSTFSVYTHITDEYNSFTVLISLFVKLLLIVMTNDLAKPLFIIYSSFSYDRFKTV